MNIREFKTPKSSSAVDDLTKTNKQKKNQELLSYSDHKMQSSCARFINVARSEIYYYYFIFCFAPLTRSPRFNELQCRAYKDNQFALVLPSNTVLLSCLDSVHCTVYLLQFIVHLSHTDVYLHLIQFCVPCYSVFLWIVPQSWKKTKTFHSNVYCSAEK